MTQQYYRDLRYIRSAHKYERNFNKRNDDDQKGYLEAVIRLYGKELLEGEFLLAAKRLLPEQFHTSQNTHYSAVPTFNKILFGTLMIIGNVLQYTTAISNHNNQINTNQYSIGKFGNLIIPTGNKIHHTTFTELFNQTATNFELLFGHNITHGITPRSSQVLFDSTIGVYGKCINTCHESWTIINNKQSSVVSTVESTIKIQDKNSTYWQETITHEFTHLIMSYLFQCRVTPLMSEGIAEVNAVITTYSDLQGKSLPLHSNCNMYNDKLRNQYQHIRSIDDYDIQGSFIIYLINVHPEIFYKWLHTRGDVNEVINQCNFDNFKQWFYVHCVQQSIVLSNEEQFTLDKSNTKFLTTPKTITNTPSKYSNKNKIFSFNHKIKQYEALRCNTTDKKNTFECEYTNNLTIPVDYTTLMFTHNDQGHEFVDAIIKRLDLDKGLTVFFLQDHSQLECIDYGQKLFVPNTLNQIMKDNVGQIQWSMSALYKVLKEGNICQQITTKYQNINFIYTATPLTQKHYKVILDDQSYDETHTNNNTNILHIYQYLKSAGITVGIMGTTIVGVIVGICGYKKYIKSAEQHEPQEEADGIPLQPLTISNIELPASVAIVQTAQEPTELHTRQQNIEDENEYLIPNDGTEYIYDTIGSITEPIYANLQG